MWRHLNATIVADIEAEGFEWQWGCNGMA